ncbi:hypothetical protein [Promicromonospora sp. NPDC019610]|uniref:hypothetical protein n=1 Tax=Promicromonospora sp. NPDC019610 TaxID=3364405 RepID=UPI0037BDF2A2
MTAPAARPGRSARVVLVALVVVGLALLGTAAWVGNRPAPTGWFAYAPLSDTTYVPGGVSSPRTVAVLSAAGTLLLGGAAGFAVGRRSRPAAGTQPD